MAWQRFNTGKHGHSLHFGSADHEGKRIARHHTRGRFEVTPQADGSWSAARFTHRGKHELGTAASAGLAMSLCAQFLESNS